MKKIINVLLYTLILITSINVACASKPVATDSRIKTFVYSENEVFRIVVHYGYQTSIEFADGEEIQTISVGNNYAWQLTPLGRRLFIRPLEDNILTNMTILTNKRAYQFEVQSKLLSYTIDEELVYVVRFFYPDNEMDAVKPKVSDSVEGEVIPVVKPYNFNYTLSGKKCEAEPVKVFDDGINTFFEFSPGLSQLPQIINKSLLAAPLVPKQKGKFIIVNTTAQTFELSSGNCVVTVHNESYR